MGNHRLPLVYVLVVNWNGIRDLEMCLPSLVRTSYPNLRIVVLDNGSKDGSPEWVKTNFPQVIMQEFGHNLGFTGANNAGMQLAMEVGADYAILLNNDTRVEPDWVDALIEVVEHNPSVAICQARQRTWDGRHDIRFRFIPEWAEAETVLYPIDSSNIAVPSAFASGCAMMVRCSVLRQIGLLDERYFIYAEDVDLSLRTWIAGYQVMDVPAAIVYHHWSSSVPSKRRMFLGYRNQLTTILKLYERETLHSLAEPISRRWFRTRNRTALRGTMAALAILPDTLARRRLVQRNRMAPDAQFLELCVR